MLNSVYTDKQVLAKKNKTIQANNVANLNNSDYIDPTIEKPTSVLPRPKINTEPDFIKPESTSSLYSDYDDTVIKLGSNPAINKFSNSGGSTSDEWINNQKNKNGDDSDSDDDGGTGTNNAGLIGGSGDYVGAATGALALGGSIAAREKSDPQSKKESTQSALALGAQGAALGATVGGPWGAAIGFVAGTGYGLIKGGADAKKLTKKAQQEQATFLARTTQEREAAQRLADGKDEIQKSKNILQNQMGLIGAQYINNQNS